MMTLLTMISRDKLPNGSPPDADNCDFFTSRICKFPSITMRMYVWETKCGCSNRYLPALPSACFGHSLLFLKVGRGGTATYGGAALRDARRSECE